MKCHPAVDGLSTRLSSAHVDASAIGSPVTGGQYGLIAASIGDAVSTVRIFASTAGLSRRSARIATARWPSHPHARAGREPAETTSTNAQKIRLMKLS